MQFIEKNSFNVRSAIYHLKKDGSGTEYLLFPMIHVGTKEYYDEVSDRLKSCDLILIEGVQSKRAGLLTLSYRIVSKIKRMDLVTQQEGMKIANLRSKIFNSDMTGEVFDQRWDSLPLVLRLQLVFYIPIFVVYLFLFGTREIIAEHLAFEDLPSSEEILNQDDNYDKLDMLLIDERDRQLIQNIEKINSTATQDKQVVGIVYGAHHMRNVVNYLSNKLNYKVVNADWVTVFDL